ncbi:methyltransferase domain-containing protein [Beijerinckia sp. L45]|uniref:methyltransferase domain-containing protein n=1 Tax=Beijerinckia sp. L45 TaxID=1641855 RepID=UPI00131BA330|nr:methyltransferase domain-containing protein [Beijerinckia sp. L45]
MNIPSSLPPMPVQLNLGSGKDFRDDFLNLDVDDTWGPDAVCDLSAIDESAQGLRLTTTRFGEITLRPACFDRIIANDVLEHVPDLMAMMTRCLQLLRVGGVFAISVPYDLSFGAWQDPTHVRAFNERSWLYYTDWFWYMGWSEHRFVIDSFDFVPSPLGEDMKSRNVPRDEILRAPRAIDSMSVVLRKIELTDEDRGTWAFWRERKRQAQSRNAKPASQSPVVSLVSRSEAIASEPAGPKAFDGPLSAHRDRYALWIVTPGDYAHQHAYDDLALGLSEAFGELGGSAPIVRDPTEAARRTLIVLGPQLLPQSAQDLLPKDTVLFNLEQVQDDSPWMNRTYLTLLRQHPVLDYSVRNRSALVERGIGHARVLPIGYAPGLKRVPLVEKQDIDVLFYGSLNGRRRDILDALTARGVKVEHLFGVYGAERDSAIGRAKIVLNMHFYDAAIFESVRVSFLLANGACVVSEGHPDDPDVAPFAGGLVVSGYQDLVERCVALLSDDAERKALGQAGFAAVARRRQSDLLRSLFDA